MFKLSEKYQIDRRTLKYDYIRYSPSEISIINTPNSQIYQYTKRRQCYFIVK